MHEGQGHYLGEKGGQQAHTLSTLEMPQHNHRVLASSANASQSVPSTRVLGGANNLYLDAPDIDPVTGIARAPEAVPMVYAAAGALTTLHPSTLGSTGGSQAHLNMQPFLVLNFCIALQGVFPTHS